MFDTAGLVRLLSWLSPVFPTGNFAYSSGLEAAVQSHIVSNEAELGEWLTDVLRYGALRNDALLIANAFANCNDLNAQNATAELALALAGCAERYLESTAQGEAFVQAVRNWPGMAEMSFPQPCPLAVSIGVAAGRSGLDLQHTLNAYLHSFVTNQVQAAIRLSVLGQSGAGRLLAHLEPVILSRSEAAAISSLDDMGSATMMADIMAMKHEELQGRLFRS